MGSNPTLSASDKQALFFLAIRWLENDRVFLFRTVLAKMLVGFYVWRKYLTT